MKTECQIEAMRRIDRILPKLKAVHVDALFDVSDEWYSYKFISLYCAIAEIALCGDWVELGVYKGRCARFLGNLVPADRRLHLLDSFEGLPEDWIGKWKKGAFSLPPNQVPAFDNPNVSVLPGWFNETVPELAARLSRPLAFIHMDADLYSSTLDALNGFNEVIAPGTVILFDEYVMQVGDEFSDDEHRALLDWCRFRDRKFEYLWKTRWVQVAIRITD